MFHAKHSFISAMRALDAIKFIHTVGGNEEGELTLRLSCPAVP